MHKAGIHAKAVLADPSSYEALNPADFGLTREIVMGHRLTGWNTVRARAQTLGLALDDEAIQIVTRQIKSRADIQPMTMIEIDALLQSYEPQL